MPIYCNYEQWLKEQKGPIADYYDALRNNCVIGEGLKCNTLIIPTAEQIKHLIKLSNGDKRERREFLQRVSAHMLQVDLHSKQFQPGTYKNNNRSQSVLISAPSNGVFELGSGQGHKTKASLKLVTNFEVDWKYTVDEDRNNCIVQVISGEIAIDGDVFTGEQPIRNKPVKGSGEVSHDSCNGKLESWHAIIGSVMFDLEHKCNPSEPTARLCGLLKHLLMHCDKVPELKHCADIVHVAMSYEPLAALYILMQPYGGKQLMPQRLNDEWCFAPYVCEDPNALMHEFKEKFPCSVDKSQRDSIISQIKSEVGMSKLYELQDAYTNHCKSLFSSINYPCEMKLWCDEVSYFISKRMCRIRKSHDKEEFIALCKTLHESFPGDDYSAESRIGDDKFWEGIGREHEMKDIEHFLNSYCCLQCCPCDDSLSKECSQYFTGSKPSNYLRSILMLNREHY